MGNASSPKIKTLNGQFEAFWWLFQASKGANVIDLRSTSLWCKKIKDRRRFIVADSERKIEEDDAHEVDARIPHSAHVPSA